MLECELTVLYIDEDYFQYLLEALHCAYNSGSNTYYLYVNKPPAPTMNQNDQIFERNKSQTIEEEISEEEEMEKVIDNRKHEEASENIVPVGGPLSENQVIPDTTEESLRELSEKKAKDISEKKAEDINE
jgi:hypothetical protein